jgi:hypothetical protein
MRRIYFCAFIEKNLRRLVGYTENTEGWLDFILRMQGSLSCAYCVCASAAFTLKKFFNEIAGFFL